MNTRWEDDHPLRPIVAGWLNKIRLAREAKKRFQETADECMNFFCGPVGFMWSDGYKKKLWGEGNTGPTPRFQMTVNKAFELVALFGPVLYHRNPDRVVSPRRQLNIPPALFQPDVPPGTDPMLAQSLFMQGQMQHQAIAHQQARQSAEDDIRAQLMSTLLNYSPREMPHGGLQRHAQRAITEALVKGRGTLWIEDQARYSSGRRLIGSYYDTVDNIVIDPDAESLDDALWIARRCVAPTWKVERDFGLPDGALKDKGRYASANAQGESETREFHKDDHARGKTNDLMVYWKIWSKMGIGARQLDVPPHLRSVTEGLFGDYVHLVLADDVPFPLNLNDELLSQPGREEELKQQAAWPVPFWADDLWPVQVLDFYERPRSCWPISPLEPGLGELKFINVMVSHLCHRIWMSSRTLVGVLKGASDRLKDILENGEDLEIVELSQITGKSITDLVSFLEHPPLNQDAWRILESAMQLFDKRVGLTELVYGLTQRQMRSAQEASVKQDQISIRPDYMAQQVEHWATGFARQEAIASRFLYEPPDVVQLLGPYAGQMWNQYVAQRDVNLVVRELEYRVEAGSTRRPNKDSMRNNVSELLQFAGPFYQQLATTGQPDPWNTLMDKWAKASDENADGLYVQPPPQPQPMPPQGGQATATAGADM